MPRLRLVCATGLSTAALLVGGVGSLGAPFPATAAAQVPGDSASCPAAFPSADLTLGQEVTGLTTAGSYRRDGVEHDSTTTPDEFSGFYRGSIDDPGGDLLVFELEGSRITNPDGTVDAGIWAGMSGSPLYAADGRLIGAVSYSFSSVFGSTYAGVTPADRLYSLLDDVAPVAPARVGLTTTEKSRLVRAGLSPDAADQGLRRLAPVTTLAGTSGANPKALARMAKRFGMATPVLAGGAGRQAEPVAIEPGSNFAAADSYGTISLFGVGTTTAVCDDTAIAFGHPANWRPMTQSVHGATTTIIQKDGAGSYKMANLAAPSGTLTGDHLAGITGRLGPLPQAAEVTSVATGPHPRESASHVPNSLALAYVVANQTYLDTLLTLDQDAGGDATLSWTISYLRANGSAETFTRSGRYSVDSYLSELVTGDVASDVDAIVNNPFEDVTVTGVHIKEAFSRSPRMLRIGSVQWRKGTTWVRVGNGRTIPIMAGRRMKVRINLVPTSRTSKAAPVSKVMTYTIPKNAARRGFLMIEGHAASFEDDFFEEMESGESGSPASFAALLTSLKQPRQDDVTITLTHRTTAGKQRVVNNTWRTPGVTQGFYALLLQNKAR